VDDDAGIRLSASILCRGLVRAQSLIPDDIMLASGEALDLSKDLGKCRRGAYKHSSAALGPTSRSWTTGDSPDEEQKQERSVPYVR
jgi:hypothetical protein